MLCAVSQEKRTTYLKRRACRTVVGPRIEKAVV